MRTILRAHHGTETAEKDMTPRNHLWRRTPQPDAMHLAGGRPAFGGPVQARPARVC
jgi:hypothetical protein